MKKSILVTALVLAGLTGSVVSAKAYERREEPRAREVARDYRDSTDYRQLRAEIYQLNILFSRVSNQLRYGSGRYVRSDFSRLLRDRDRLNYELRSGSSSPGRIHSQIDRLRDELRELDVRLRVHRYSHWH
jgi:hypothetical protein